ncbi:MULTISPECIES: GntR family transcriptional regulator [Pseudomonas syringae group]|uniref:Uncharacterized protein n=2 Tax=Pseudomonas syringae group TaxID=136849 RepID=A0A2V4QL51_PSESJ|nr:MULTISPECIES: GntR family transcriptional regulator [Pseudomonas syringae group]AZG89372.1 GntR family transcriptional regulator [Pseudomonas syringae pv. pisi str. PP1]PYD08708.1 GntR family transcriptional regulator [Pseudomonas syringae pv. pisi]PYD24421.1 GntR family transcriptional regulator [Pseudomonas syringae pv. pisi]PYD27182.1 GntR family transcriptional regulator [Pseudomonas syringae pv. pisi]RML63960.1 hypothetical protein ALQ92_200253 [Pseudomonas syringae pv. pisi]
MINHRTQKLHAQHVLEAIAIGIAQPIANAFQVSRMPVREALRSLETQGYIAAQYHKGYLVTNGNEPPQYGHLPGLLRCVAEGHKRLADLESKVAFENEILRVLGQLRPTPC